MVDLKAVVLFVRCGPSSVRAGAFKDLDWLAANGQSGFLSTVPHDGEKTDLLDQIIGATFFDDEQLDLELGRESHRHEGGHIILERKPLKLAVLAPNRPHYGAFTSIAGLELPRVAGLVDEFLRDFAIVVVEVGSLGDADLIVARFRGGGRVGISVIVPVPCFAPPVSPLRALTPSYKVVGPRRFEALSLDSPLMFVSYLADLSRVDAVGAFDVEDVHAKCGMLIEPVSQVLKGLAYYAGSAEKYGA